MSRFPPNEAPTAGRGLDGTLRAIRAAAREVVAAVRELREIGLGMYRETVAIHHEIKQRTDRHERRTTRLEQWAESKGFDPHE